MSANIEIDKNTCTGCQTCVEACFVDVMRRDPTEEMPVVAYEHDCVWCFTCEINCPARCINVKPHLPGQPVSPY